MVMSKGMEATERLFVRKPRIYEVTIDIYFIVFAKLQHKKTDYLFEQKI